MYTRSTAFAVTSRASRYTSIHGAEILRLQEQISSGLKLNKPSDNPLAFRQASALQGQLQSLRAADDIISDATTKLNISVSQLTEFGDLLASAGRLAQQGVQTLGQTERNALAIEAEELLSRMQSIANSQHADQFMYGGARSNRAPFEFQRPRVEGSTLVSNYVGASRPGESVILPGTSVETLYAGDELFRDNRRGQPVIYGPPGPKIGQGTSTLVGRATLQVRHLATTYAAGSGVQAGASSAAGDTVIGPAGRHRLTINDTSGTGASGTISLNGGKPIAWDSSQTNLVVLSDSGEKVHVDMSAIVAGFNGDVDITATGTLSVDGGQSTVLIDHSGSQAITDSTSGRFVYIDSADIAATGENYLEFPGTSDAFQVVYELIQDLRGTRNLSNGQFAESLGRRMEELNHLGSKVLESMGVQAASLAALENLSTRNANLKYEAEAQLSNLQTTDISEAVLRLQNAQLLQEYTYTVTARIMSQSLVNFLQ